MWLISLFFHSCFFRIKRTNLYSGLRSFYLQFVFLLKLSYDLRRFNERYPQLWNDTIVLLSFFDRICFIRCAALVHELGRSRLAPKHLHKLQHLTYKIFGSSSNPDIGQNILNLSSFQLSTLEPSNPLEWTGFLHFSYIYQTKKFSLLCSVS